MVFQLFGLYWHRRAQRASVRLPFSRSALSREDYGPVVVSLTEKEVKRCIEAFDWYIESHADEMIEKGLDYEVGRYEDLMYRFMGVPDENNEAHAEARARDRLH